VPIHIYLDINGITKSPPFFKSFNQSINSSAYTKSKSIFYEILFLHDIHSNQETALSALASERGRRAGRSCVGVEEVSYQEKDV
jgi:hypothetical protein